jgi:hypothetical protein
MLIAGVIPDVLTEFGYAPIVVLILPLTLMALVSNTAA